MVTGRFLHYGPNNKIILSLSRSICHLWKPIKGEKWVKKWDLWEGERNM